jgi:hypothetical protein
MDEMSTQTQESSLVNVTDNSIQSNKPNSPDIAEKKDFDVQVDLLNNEFQIISKLDTQDSQIQTTPTKRAEMMIQTSSFESLDPTKIDDLLTNNDKPMVINKEEYEVQKLENVTTSELSTQTKPNEFILTAEQSVQFIPDSSEISSQTIPLNILSEAEDLSKNKIYSDDFPLKDQFSENKEIKTEINKLDEYVDKPKSYSAAENMLVEQEKVVFKNKNVPIESSQKFSENIGNIEIPITEIQMKEKIFTTPLDIIEIESLPFDDTEIKTSKKLPIERLEISEIESLPLDDTESQVSIRPQDQNIQELQTTSNNIVLIPKIEMPSDFVLDDSNKDSEMEMSYQDVSSTPESSFEIQIQATVEMCDSTTSDLTSQNVTITEEFSEEESLKAKRQKRKRHRNKTVEINDPIQQYKISDQDSTSFKDSNLDIIDKIPDQITPNQSSKDNKKHLFTEPELINIKTESKLLPDNIEDAEVHDPKIVELDASTEIKSYENPLIQDVDTIDSMTPVVQNIINPKDSITHKTERTKLMLDRTKSSPNLKKRTQLPHILHISKLEKSDPEKLNENKILEMPKNLEVLKEAVEQKNSTIIEQIFITVVETLSTWLENIESKIYLNKETSNDSSQNNADIIEFKNEINNVRGKIHELNDIWIEAELSYPQHEREKLKQYIQALKSQAIAIEEVAENEEMCITSEINKWNEFLNEVKDIGKLVSQNNFILFKFFH